jgi:hypothetical protein
MLVVGGFAFLAPSAALAQNEPFNPKPVVSPYLLLLQNNGISGNGSPNYGVYQQLVKPQLDAQLNRQQNPQQGYNPGGTAGSLQSRSPQTTGASNSVRPTGHAATFMNTSHYFNSNTGRTSGHR